MATRKPKATRSMKSAAEKRAPAEERLIHILMPYILGGVSVFLGLCFLLSRGTMGIVGDFFRDTLLGLFSFGAYLIPFLLMAQAILYARDLKAGSNVYKFAFSGGIVLFTGTVCALLGGYPANFNLKENFLAAKSLSGGGAVGGLLHAALCKLVGTPGAWIVSTVALLIFTCFLFGKTPADLVRGVIRPFFLSVKEGAEERHERQLLAKEERARQIAIDEAESANHEEKKEKKEKKGVATLRFGKKKCDVQLETGEVVREEVPEELVPDDEFRIKLPAEDETLDPTYDPTLQIPLKGQKKQPEIVPIEEVEPEPLPDLHHQIRSIFQEEEGEVNFGSDEVMDEIREAEKNLKADLAEKYDDDQPPFELDEEKIAPKITPVELGVEPHEKEEPEYRFPPLSFLTMPPPKTQQNDAEQQMTARKLVDTLQSFGVKTNIIGISKGPTVTRYELQPQMGVRVRSILNLSDDIALALASSGVRMEAPIPGKEAVGIEVPNRGVETVYLRELIDSEEFRGNKSRLHCCLGMDVAGKAVYCDLSKMPHTLIAGATGMGKSVCLNSLIVSILYHATPEEVKMIMIDPKNVEMRIYSGIPHLMVPVVSDPKKAAGALNSAVIEMEKRFVLLGEVGVRDIKSYNEAVKNDPERRPMPHIVIIIDELADLMMTARDEVETSICRIAQKARAAGIHLVIGTQRPSVNVVTGLIKANVPSRIAFTVASQVDSRTIIDIAGAEKLIGRGDMLYAPVGSMKPLRVQGSFVTEKEIEAICDFIRDQREADYDEGFINLIEREANKCGEKRKGGNFGFSEGDDSEESDSLFGDKDPLLDRAIEVAVTENKVSTSLLQRKLSVGYARAAKLIDFMAEMNVVGPYAGSKPREVLWTKQFYDEYRLKARDSAPISLE